MPSTFRVVDESRRVVEAELPETESGSQTGSNRGEAPRWGLSSCNSANGPDPICTEDERIRVISGPRNPGFPENGHTLSSDDSAQHRSQTPVG